MRFSAARRFIPPGPCPAACAIRWTRRAAPGFARGCRKRSPPPKWPSTCSRRRWRRTSAKSKSSAISRPCSWALVTADGSWEHYDGNLRFSDSSGSIIADQLDPRKYDEFIGESVQGSSYLKSPYYAPLGFPGWHVSRRPAGAAQHLRTHGRAAGGRRAEEFQEPGAGRGDLLVPLSLRAADRNPGRAGIHRARPWTTRIC